MVAGGMVGSSASIFRWIRRSDGHPESATMASILPSLFNNIWLVLISMIGLVHLILSHDLSRPQIVAFSAIVLILAILIGGGAIALKLIVIKLLHS